MYASIPEYQSPFIPSFKTNLNNMQCIKDQNLNLCKNNKCSCQLNTNCNNFKEFDSTNYKTSNKNFTSSNKNDEYFDVKNIMENNKIELINREGKFLNITSSFCLDSAINENISDSNNNLNYINLTNINIFTSNNTLNNKNSSNTKSFKKKIIMSSEDIELEKIEKEKLELEKLKIINKSNVERLFNKNNLSFNINNPLLTRTNLLNKKREYSKSNKKNNNTIYTNKENNFNCFNIKLDEGLINQDKNYEEEYNSITDNISKLSVLNSPIKNISSKQIFVNNTEKIKNNTSNNNVLKQSILEYKMAIINEEKIKKLNKKEIKIKEAKKNSLYSKLNLSLFNKNNQYNKIDIDKF